MFVTIRFALRSAIPVRAVLVLLLGALAGCGSTDDPVAAFENADYETARRLFNVQAENGDANAQNYMGVMYYIGLGVERDYEAAARWFKAAALAGHSTAQRNLATLYHQGLGVPKDNVRAYAWFQRAADEGNAEAVQFLEAMANQITPNQIIQGRGLIAAELAAHRRGAPAQPGGTTAESPTSAEASGIPSDLQAAASETEAPVAPEVDAAGAAEADMHAGSQADAPAAPETATAVSETDAPAAPEVDMPATFEAEAPAASAADMPSTPASDVDTPTVGTPSDATLPEPDAPGAGPARGEQ